MRTITLSAALLLAVPVAAYADPPQTQSFEHERYDHWNDSHWAHDYHGHWRSFGQTFNARNDRQFVNLGGGRYHMLRLEAVRGEPKIDRVTVLFNDGTSQTVQLDTELTSGAGEVIRLDPDRRVRRVIVFTEPTTHGLYSVSAG